MARIHLTPRDYRRMPWKNGGGETTELLAQPSDQPGGFLWRLSIADVGTSGPFSHFAGIDRTIMLLQGRGMVLDFDQAPTQVLDRPYEPFSFNGEWRTDCRLIDGPIQDFNLMINRAAASGELTVLRMKSSTTLHRDIDDICVIHVLEGDAVADDIGLNTRDTLHLDGEQTQPLSLQAGINGAVLAVATIRPRRHTP